MKKSFAFTIIIITIAALAIGGYAAANSGLFARDMILEKGADATKTTSVPITESIDLTSVEIRNLPEIDIDGSLIFEARDAISKKAIGTFNYMPWNEKRPVYLKLETGDIILGKDKIFKINEKKIENLAGNLNMSVFDYDVNGNNIAIIGKKEDSGSDISVCVKDMASNKDKLIDTFRYPEFKYPEVVYLDWGENGMLYYDFFENNKPVIKAYNQATGQKTIFLEGAMNPQVSPDGKYIALLEVNSLEKEDRLNSTQQLYDISSKKKLARINGSRKLFWTEKNLVVRNVDDSKLEIYRFGDVIEKVKDIPFYELPYDVSDENNVIKIKSYKFEDSNVVKNEHKIYLDK